MAGAYDDRDGWIWMDGKLVPWRDANVHILTHALHYASSVFEGERCYNGKNFKGVEHSERLRRSANLLDMEIPYSVEEIEAAKYEIADAMLNHAIGSLHQWLNLTLAAGVALVVFGVFVSMVAGLRRKG